MWEVEEGREGRAEVGLQSQTWGDGGIGILGVIKAQACFLHCQPTAAGKNVLHVRIASSG